MTLQRTRPLFLMTSIDTRHSIAARIRALISCEDPGPAQAAIRLGVSEEALRAAMDYVDPNPSAEVLAAVVVLYGVDPTWLTSGSYDAGTHRSAIEGHSSAERDHLIKLIARKLDDDEPDQSRLEA